ncbi:hypothetical protein Tco_0761603 [Tanacetum coccineum]
MEMEASREVKALSRLVEEKVLRLENSSQETLWNNLVPKKIIIFELKALKGRLPAQEKIDLDSVLCPSCDNIVEFCVHGLVLLSCWDVDAFLVGSRPVAAAGHMWCCPRISIGVSIIVEWQKKSSIAIYGGLGVDIFL